MFVIFGYGYLTFAVHYINRCVIANPEKGLCAASGLTCTANHWGTFNEADNSINFSISWLDCPNGN
jgi:hypothetical protein